MDDEQVRRVQNQQLADDEARAAADPEEQPRRRLTPTVVIIASVILVTAFVVAILVFADPPEDPREAPEDWDSLSFAPAEDATVTEDSLDLDSRNGRDVQVIVHASKDLCWNGYVGEAPIDGCGRWVFEVSNAPATLGLNVTSEANERLFLGLAVWDGEGDTKLHSLETKKAFGTLAVTLTS